MKGLLNGFFKITAIVLSATLLLSACANAGGKPSSAPPAATAVEETGQDMDSTGEKVVEPLVLPFVTEPTTLVWATRDSWYPQASYNNGLQAWEEIQEKTGVKIEWQVLGADYNDQMKLRLAAGTDLPDILRSPGNMPQYGAAGIFLQLEDLIDSYAPSILKVWEENVPARQLATSADGHIYGISVIMKEHPPYHWQIRYDWLEKLGLDKPVTTDDWLNVFEAFKTQDPDGNGLDDTVASYMDPLVFGEAFGVELYMNGVDFQEREDGRVGYKWADPRVPEILEYAKLLYDSGYLWPEYGTTNREEEEDGEAMIYRGIVGTYLNYNDWGISYNDEMRRTLGRDDVGFTSIPPAKGPRGDCFLNAIQVTGVGGTAISKDCKDPRLAMKMIDYLYSDEGQMYMAWGIEGLTYEYDQDGKPTLTDYTKSNPDGLGISDVIRTVGGWPTTHWVQRQDVYVDISKGVPEFENSAAMLAPYYHVPHFSVAGTVDEQDEVAALLADMNTHREEQIHAFITGKRPISEFDKFVNELKAMGMERAEEIEQIKYDRLKSQVDLSKIKLY